MSSCSRATAISAGWSRRSSARGVRVSVASTLRTSPPMVADELRRQADTFIDLQDLAPRIQREPRPAGYRVPTPARPELGEPDAG